MTKLQKILLVVIIILMFVLGGAIGYYFGYDIGYETSVRTIFKFNDQNETENENLRNLNISPGQKISSPLVLTGEARGTWFFEASFPVVLTDWDGLIIAQGYAQADTNWMTTDFVPFKSTLTFDKPAYKDNGSLILRKDNPSGLPENDDFIEIPILFE
ncbi:MAG: hypothetical protein A2826_01755 [Candidatus Doudnabacteria bacterium RIFCSPHIGHO2_01_FULL_43_23]|uniref:Bacterial spore germination immunoglobulin-like domain-containing protein n=1 Tax=Candidatus Doudnabacteria bacterium RIFCSPHIGHO2_01_FULL_43_23 TaxID=1817822 RepID=A0A1F5NTI7_9BACT|nr:MAG: hypothetical protein A2826_01755 [Candidatus Doudnabacteria bacterium RIFCSPHIGHO2_01_FULL_43_23]